jgi:hypothetical protein
MKDGEENARVPSSDDGDDRYVAAFESEFEAQRRRSDLESRLQAALKELDRQRGRVIALEERFHEHDRPGYEYIMLPSKEAPTPIEDLNKFAKEGWRIVTVCYDRDSTWIVIMERPASA